MSAHVIASAHALGTTRVRARLLMLKCASHEWLSQNAWHLAATFDDEISSLDERVARHSGAFKIVSLIFLTGESEPSMPRTMCRMRSPF